MIESRRGFLSLLGVGIIAAPAIVRSASLMKVNSGIMLRKSPGWKRLPPLFQDGDLTYNGVIIRNVADLNLIEYRSGMFIDYVRQNLESLKPRLAEMLAEA